MPTSLNVSQFPAHLCGLHDIGGRDPMVASRRPGWLLDTVDLGAQTGTDYTSLAQAGFGLLVRLNNGYGSAGTLPPSDQYDTFAAKCAAYVGKSPGARIWIIGNEPNLSAERPTLSNGSREIITPDKYAQCFRKCYAAIRNTPGHSEDWIIPAAVGPYNSETVYPGNVTGDWVRYLVDVLTLIGPQVDGIALHCYTHKYDSSEITSEALMAPPFNHRHYQFRAYRDFLEELPDAYRTLPVFITETNPVAGWRDSNMAWIQTAFKEIDGWNSNPAHQPIQALVLFRWFTLADHPEWGIQDKPALVADFKSALSNAPRVRWPDRKQAPSPAPRPDYRVQWIQTIDVPNGTMAANSVLCGRVVVKNAGAKPWSKNGPNPVRLGYHWYNHRNEETPVWPYAGNFPLPNDVAPGEKATFDGVELRAPQWAGAFVLKWDLVQEGVTWFSDRQSPTQDVKVQVSAVPAPDPNQPRAPVPDPWAVLFLGHDTPVSMVAGHLVSVNLRIKNLGASAWSQGGDNPVHVGYKWFNEVGNQQLDVEDRRTALPSTIVPGQEVLLGVLLASPKTPGKYHLRWDLVAEGVTWFADAGNPPLVVPISVTALPSDIGSWRVESNMNPQDVAFTLDGDTRTVWDSRVPQAPGQWFRLNLSSPRLIDGLQFLSPGKGFPSGYTLRISADGKQWTEVARVAQDNAYDVMAVFASQQTQYAQIDLLSSPSSQSSWMISEILIHPATPWNASASHNSEAAGYAIDNRLDTEWSAGIAQAQGMWFQIDLGRTETVSGLELISSPDEYPMSFRIAAWDGQSNRWQIVYEKLGNDGQVDAVFDAVTTQFINVQLLESSPQPWSIRRANVVREMDTWLGPSRAK